MTFKITSTIKTEEPKVPKSFDLLIFSIIIIITYTISSFIILSFGENISSVFFFWAIITPYMLYVMNYFKEKRKNKKLNKILIHEIKKILLDIVGLSQLSAQVIIEGKLKSINQRFKKELRDIFCFIDDDEFSNKITLTIYTKEGKYIANYANIIKNTSKGNNIAFKRRES